RPIETGPLVGRARDRKTVRALQYISMSFARDMRYRSSRQIESNQMTLNRKRTRQRNQFTAITYRNLARPRPRGDYYRVYLVTIEFVHALVLNYLRASPQARAP